MGDSRSWSIDRLAANNLLASLKLEATSETLDVVAEHFSKHRRNSIEWAAKRVHSSVIRTLESALPPHFDRQGENWAEGARFAEHQVATMIPEDLLELPSDTARTKGQVLRAMVRQARNR